MDRRTLINTLGASTVLLAANGATTASAAGPTSGTTGKKDLNAIIDAAQMCIKNGNACIKHCVDLLSTGDKSMAACLISTQDMVAVSELIIKLASANSPQLNDFLPLSSKVSADCAKVCEQHAGHHNTCKACAQCCQHASKAYTA